MIEDVVITHENVRDSITLDGKDIYSALLTVGLEKGTDFYLKIRFLDLTIAEFKQLAELTKEKRAIPISSPFFTREGFDITQIVIFNFSAKSDYTMSWEALSDKDINLIL